MAARLVRCPKCSKLILEYPEVPVYKCGGCDTVLRAKNATSSEESDVPGQPQRNQSNSTSESSTLTAAPSSLPATSNKEDASTESQALSSSGFIAENKLAGSVEGVHKNDSKEQIDNSSKINEHISDTAEHSSHSKRGMQEDSLDRVPRDDGVDDVTRSPSAASSHFYDGSISSDEGIKDRNLDHPKSRRTFKHRTHSDNVYQDRETQDVLRNGKTDASTKESVITDILRSIEVIRDEVYSKYPIRNRDRRISLDFDHQNETSWIKQDKDTLLRTQSDGPAMRSDLQDMEMLKRIEELKYRIVKLYGLNEYENLGRAIDKERPSSANYPGELNYRNRHSGNSLPDYDHRRMKSSGSGYDLRSVSSDGGSSGKYSRDSERPKVNEKPKQRCRSLGNAAPFVVCYNCMELLQLPADLLISRKKPNKLKCGACNEVLTMSFASTALPRPENHEGSSPTDKVDDTNNDSKNEGTAEFSYPDGHPYSDKVMGRLHMLMGYDSARDILYSARNILYQHDEGKNAPVESLRGSSTPSDSEEQRQKNSTAKSARSRPAGLTRS